GAPGGGRARRWRLPPRGRSSSLLPTRGPAKARGAGARVPDEQRMNPSRLFILRPVATTLLMVAVLLVGFVADRQLPISALPQVDYPTIQVFTFYPCASPEVMAASVTAPLERQF